MSAQAVCANCLETIGADHLTQAIVLRGRDRPMVALDTAIVHVDCDDPRGAHMITCYLRSANRR